MSPEDTIEDVYSGTDEQAIDKFLYQSESISTVYDYGDADNYLAYIDVSGDNGKTSHPQDAVFAYDTTQGEMIDSVNYDKKTGLAYIPKGLFDDSRMAELSDEQVELQAQTLVRYDLSQVSDAYEQDKHADVIGDEPVSGDISAGNTIPVEIETDAGSASKMAQVPLMGNQFAVEVVDERDAELLELDDLSVSLNDGAIEMDGREHAYSEGTNKPSLSYDDTTGILNIYNISPAQVMNMRVSTSAFAAPSMASRAALATAGTIKDPTAAAYKIGSWGTANCTGGYGENAAQTKTIRRWGAGGEVQNFSDITKAHMSDESCAYVITIGSCPSAIGSSWTADGSKRWQANCVHASYPNGAFDPPSGGYWKVLDANANNQTVTIAFFITCDGSGQEGAMVLTFSAPRNGELTLHKKSNANPFLGAARLSSVPNATFGVYTSKAAAQQGGSSGLVKKMTTDSNGIATSTFEKGKYYIRELRVPWPYLLSDQILSFSSKPGAKEKLSMTDDTVPPIQIKKRIVPTAGSSAEASISTSNGALRVSTSISSDGKQAVTTLYAEGSVSNIAVTNLYSQALGAPTSSDPRFSQASGTFSTLNAGESATFSQEIKKGQGWSNKESKASICSVKAGSSRIDMSLPLHVASLEGTRYGIYSDSACTRKIGESELNASGVGYYGKKSGETLQSNTTYYVRETAGTNGYTTSSEIYPVTTSRNSQVSVDVSDSFSTLILTKKNASESLLNGKFPQFTVKGAKYGVFADCAAAEQRDASRTVIGGDGKRAIIVTDGLGKASTVSLGAGTYYIAELPSNITCNQSTTIDNSAPSDIEASIAAHDYASKPNGKFLLDEEIHEVRLQPGKTSFVVSNEKVPVKIQLSKQSLRPDLSSLSQFSIEGAVFGVYSTESAARSAQVSENYGKPGDEVSANGAVAVLYGSKSGLTTVSRELSLQDYWIKEIRAPRNYKATGDSTWSLNNTTSNSEIIHLKASDFISSGKFVDGMFASPIIVKSNQPEDVTVQVHKDASEVPDNMKNAGNAMSLAGARFAVYRTYDDAKQDVNRLSFRTDDQPASDSTLTDLLTTKADGWSNKAIGLPAEENYWVREIEPPHVVSDDPVENEKNIAESMYLLNDEPMKASFTEALSVDMLANQDEQVKPVSITIGKYPMSIDPEGRNLHVGEKDANSVPYNDAYTDSALEGAVFALFDTREQAENAKVTDDVSDLSVEQAAWDAGAIAVMTSDANGVCGTVDNLRWKADGYYLRELKAPSSGCYKRNESILLVSCDRNTLDSEHIRLDISEDKISRFFELDEMPNYYYVKIEKTSTDSSVLADKSNYSLEGIHFGIYKTYEEAAAATEEQPGNPLYNLYTKEVTHEDGTVHYEAVSGLTGPGVFWAKELIAEDAPSNGFEKLTLPIRVEAKLGGIPRYDTTPITPENSAPVFDESGKLGYKTAKDIDEAAGSIQTPKINISVPAGILHLNEPVGNINTLLDMRNSLLETSDNELVESPDDAINDVYFEPEGNITRGNVLALPDILTLKSNSPISPLAARSTTTSGVWNLYTITFSVKDVKHVESVIYEKYNRQAYLSTGKKVKDDEKTASGTLSSTTNKKDAWAWQTSGNSWFTVFLTDRNDGTYVYQTLMKYIVNPSTGYKVTQWKVGNNYYTGEQWDKRFSANATVQPVISPVTSTISFNNNGGSNVNSGTVKAKYDQAMPTLSKVPTKTGYTFQGYYYGTDQYYKANGTSFQKWNRTGSAYELKARWTANKYAVTLHKNDGSGSYSSVEATYNAKPKNITPPKRTGYTFQGYWDTSAATGGTQYYNASGVYNSDTWTRISGITLYARWTPITYKVTFTAGDVPANPASIVSGSPVTVNCTYGTTYKTQGVLFHKFGHAMTGWKCGSTTYAPNANFSNLTTTNGATVTMSAIWAGRQYYVKYNDGLAAQYGPAPVVDSGWTSGYHSLLWYDDYAGDGQSYDTLEPVHYSHPYFAFRYWTDQPNGKGNRYANKQSVYNLALPDQTKELYGVWTPSFDYGVNCEPNIIPNQPLGGITVQKSITGNREASAVYGDMSGIAFQLFSDPSCEQLVSTSYTDKNGIAFFTGLETGQTYYVKEDSIPEHLSSVMSKSDAVIEATPGSGSSYTFENEGKQLSIDIIKRPSQDAIESVSPEILSSIPPMNAKFAVYATEQDARNDENRIPFTDENGRQATIATTTTLNANGGIPSARTTLSGLPKQNLWLMELVAPSAGRREYIASGEPIFVGIDESSASTVSVDVPNDVKTLGRVEIEKKVRDEDLERLPDSLRGQAEDLVSGIVYALYKDKSAAAQRGDEYVALSTVSDGKLAFENLPYGRYYLVEWSLSDSASAGGISLSSEITELNVDEKASVDGFTVELRDGMDSRRMHISKVDADTKEPISGVVFDIYSDESREELLCSTSASDARGIAVSDKAFTPGRSYFVCERYDSLPGEYNGYGVGTDMTWSGWVSLDDADSTNSPFIVENTKNSETGAIELRKASNTGSIASGAMFSVFDFTGALYKQIVTDEAGIARADGVPVGRYTIRETEPLEMHSLTSDGTEAPSFEGDVLPGGCWQVNGGEPIMNYQGKMRVQKQSADPELTESLPETYSLAGAVYSIYPVEDGIEASTPLPVHMVTDENGISNTVDVPLGTYRVVETTEPANFSTPPEQKEFAVTLDEENSTGEAIFSIESVDVPATEPISGLTVEKRSNETLADSDGAAQGSTSMSGTRFAIEYSHELARDYASALSLEKERRWVVETDDEGRASFEEGSIIADDSDEIYRDSKGEAMIPVGTLVIREVLPPVGYTLDNAPTAAYRFDGDTGKFVELLPDGESRECTGTPVFTAANDIYRADISFHKADAYDESKKMANIPFVLTLLDDEGEAIERHLLVTNENGDYDSASGSLDPVNGNDDWLPGDMENGTVEPDFAPSDSRIWFSGAQSQVSPEPSKGALIYGDYELREYYRDDTSHYQSLEPVYFSVRGADGKAWIEKDGNVIENGNLSTDIGTIENHSIHIASTEFVDFETGLHVAEKGNLLATETIRYADATPGESYTFEAYAYDADTKAPITKTFVDIDGETVEVQAGGTYTLAAEQPEGEVSIDISFDGYDTENRKIGLITKVYHNGYLSDRHNENLEDDAESISFADLGTEAKDSDTGMHIGFSDGHIDMKDTVRYSNLTPGLEYEVRGVLMDKATGKELLDGSGNIVEASATFVPDARSGETELSFSFDVPSNTELTVVAYESIYAQGKLVASHKDIDDEAQTVYYPSVETTAHDAVTGNSQGSAESGKVSIIDEIAYANLHPDTDYEIRGFLYTLDENDNKRIIENTMKSVTFRTDDSRNGVARMDFEVDADLVRGKRMLVGEEIWLDGKIIAKHDDASFENQIVSYPSVSTTAYDVETGAHIANGEKERTIVDIVHLEGLKAGETYHIEGTVMARSYDKQIQQTPITAQATFTAQGSVEDHELVFELPADFPAPDAVVFETVYDKDKDHVIAKHEDPTDESQSIHYPKIGTTALHPGTGSQVGSNIDNIVVDTVYYENLLPQHSYIVTGMLVDKETGEFVGNAEGTGPVTSSIEFDVTSPTGTIDVPFDLNGIDTRGKTLVAFEKLFVKESAESTNDDARTLIATHCDIDADKQTMFYPAIRTTARDAATGTHVGSSLADAAIIDTVRYENLVPGYEYELTGTLMDKVTRKPVEVDDESVRASVKFTPSEKEGEVELPFAPLPVDIAANKTIVVFETLSLKGIEMGEHKDIEDAEQSVGYPRLATVAVDSATRLQEGNVSGGDAASIDEFGNVHVIDTVTYGNVEPGREYKVSGTLVNKHNRDVMAKAETVFIANEASGQVEVVFELDAKDAEGLVAVAFEKLLDDSGREIASHEDIEDDAQTVSYPVISTTALDRRSGTHAGTIKDIDIVDTVRYTGLLDGHRYVARGTLMDAGSGEAVIGVDGKVVTGTTIFEATEGGTGEISVEISSELPEGYELTGKTLVVFEEIEQAPAADDEIEGGSEGGNTSEESVEEKVEEGVKNAGTNRTNRAGTDAEDGTEEKRIIVIASHKDLGDEEQSIHYPSITRTLARADNDTKWLSWSETSRMTDTVTYENLVPGVEYVFEGEIIKKNDSSLLIAAGKAAKATQTFTATERSGEVAVTFELDTTMDEISDTVVFEKMYVAGTQDDDDALIAHHTDINSEDQSIHGIEDELIKTNETPLAQIEELLMTGDNLWRLLAMSGCALLSAAGILFVRTRRLYC